jgi:hypothetical protein
VRRRDFTIGLMLGAAVRQVRSQEKGLAVVGFLSSNAPATYAPAVAAFRQGLAETGYIEGQNIAIEYRWAEGRYDRLPALAADLVDRKVDVVATGGTLRHQPRKVRPRRSRLSLSVATTRSRTGWSRVSPDRAATLRASASSPSS